ncbi:MAG: AAA family ATPase [Clostridiales bacterium]|nr:AAA family ATPase [Clostridiales bacterium]
MRNAILRELQAEYDQQQMRNDQENQRRLAEVTAKCPEIAALMDERQNMIFAGLRGILDGRVQGDELPRRMDVMNKRIAQLLCQHGYAENYLEPVYRCARCKDTGYVGEPVKEMCECLRGAFYARLYQRVGLGEKARQTFESFDLNVFPDRRVEGQPFTQRQLMDMIREQCRNWAEQYPGAATSDMLLMGPSGLGKTFLMHAMAKRLLDRGFNVLMMSAYRFLDVARKAYFSGQMTELDSIMEADVLLLDDLGSEPLMENITIVQLFNLINERQTAGRGTVISTNLNVRELRERYTERIASRLTDKRQCTQVVFMGEDIRRV